ncbi:endonuclease/exonuclease/phosphatase family protein [Sphingobacterium wenxiniae]|nr:endonuclease/exonuclease/phosphatase family protein [Sphingobacterium wenxiniae]
MMKKNRFFYFVIGLLSLICTAAYGQTKLDLTVGSYNIRYDNNGDRKAGNGWENRLPVIHSLIDFIDYDVVGLQEVLVNQLHDLKEKLPDYDYVGVGRDDGKEEGEFAPIFYKKDKFTLLQSGVFWLSENPDQPSKGWDAALPRICTFVQLREELTGKTLWCFNLHMDHVGMKAREESSKLVVRKIAEMTQGTPTILTGDFNVDQHNSIYQILNSSGHLRDSYEIATNKFAWNGTFNAFDTNLWTDSRIDHVFVSDSIQVKHYAVLTESYRSKKENAEEVKKGDFPRELSFKQYESRLPSDHFPLVIKIAL